MINYQDCAVFQLLVITYPIVSDWILYRKWKFWWITWIVHDFSFYQIPTNSKRADEIGSPHKSFKGWIISEGILNIVPSSQKWTKSPSLIFQLKYRNRDLACFLEYIKTNLKITFEITPPSSWQSLVNRNFSSKSWMSSLIFWAFLLPFSESLDGPLFELRLKQKE